MALLRVEADRAGVTLRVDGCEDLPAIALDALQLEQVLLNVILNAIQASPVGAQVHIDERLERERVVIEVTDVGSGIPAEHLDQIFSPFFTTKEQGTGLGLSIAQRIVLSHRGRINVDSSPGHGTCVRIHLPLPALTGASAESGMEARV